MSKTMCCDGNCNPKTCMQLPEGKTCGDCFHGPRCFAMFGHAAEDKICDWYPRKFAQRK